VTPIKGRSSDGRNTGWALVTMADMTAAEKALAASARLQGQSGLTLTSFCKKQACQSDGAMVHEKHVGNLETEAASALRWRNKKLQHQLLEECDQRRECEPPLTCVCAACCTWYHSITVFWPLCGPLLLLQVHARSKQ
jgi:hypothetical protein